MKSWDYMSNYERLAEARRREERRARGLPLTETPVEAAERIAEDDQRLEKEIQREVVKTYTAFGCTVYNLSQARASKQTPGLPDLYAFPPDFPPDFHCRAFWHETKTPNGKQSPAQVEFQIRCRQTGASYVLGGVLAAEEHLIKLDLAERINGVLEPIRR